MAHLWQSIGRDSGAIKHFKKSSKIVNKLQLRQSGLAQNVVLLGATDTMGLYLATDSHRVLTVWEYMTGKNLSLWCSAKKGAASTREKISKPQPDLSSPSKEKFKAGGGASPVTFRAYVKTSFRMRVKSKKNPFPTNGWGRKQFWVEGS